ncbi:unnamed protein product [Lota lota]
MQPSSCHRVYKQSTALEPAVTRAVTPGSDRSEARPEDALRDGARDAFPPCSSGIRGFAAAVSRSIATLADAVVPTVRVKCFPCSKTGGLVGTVRHAFNPPKSVLPTCFKTSVTVPWL